MADILEKAKSDFAAGMRNLVELPVPEWGISIWLAPKMTIRQREQIFSKPDGGSHSGHVSMARAVMVLSLDKKGERVFTEFELDDLTHKVSADIVSRIALEMFAITGSNKSDEERVSAAKNSSKATS